MKASEVCELEGLYGPFTLAEEVLQKIWLHRDFINDDLVTTCGRSLVITNPGKWNRLEGPDFLDARFLLDGDPCVGDVEVHFRRNGWHQHGHERDTRYDNVRLHVLLFPPKPGDGRARTSKGREIPEVILLDRLNHDLEEYHLEDVIEQGYGRPAGDLAKELGGMAMPTRKEWVRESAKARWQEKVHFARLRIEKLGWTTACHETALEILGYRRNRAPMLRLGHRYPLGDWRNGELDPAALFNEESGSWRLQGMRPANHPRLRLSQYSRWVCLRPEWPAWLKSEFSHLVNAGGTPDEATHVFRRRQGMPARRKEWAGLMTGGTLGGSRLDTWICDGVFPLVAARTGADVLAWWFHWYRGDMPAEVASVLRSCRLAGGRDHPGCNGWYQGVLGLLLGEEARV